MDFDPSGLQIAATYSFGPEVAWMQEKPRDQREQAHGSSKVALPLRFFLLVRLVPLASVPLCFVMFAPDIMEDAFFSNSSATILDLGWQWAVGVLCLMGRRSM